MMAAEIKTKQEALLSTRLCNHTGHIPMKLPEHTKPNLPETVTFCSPLRLNHLLYSTAVSKNNGTEQ